MQLRIYQLKYWVFQKHNRSRKTRLFLFNQMSRHKIKEAEVEVKIKKAGMINRLIKRKFYRWKDRLKRRGWWRLIWLTPGQNSREQTLKWSVQIDHLQLLKMQIYLQIKQSMRSIIEIRTCLMKMLANQSN